MSWLWNQILIKSTLASAIAHLYNAIYSDKIATIHLGYKPIIDVTLQIPVPLYLSTLPSTSERAPPALLLTTANVNMDEDGNTNPNYLSKHAALLLLDDADKLMAEIRNEEDPARSSPLLECIKCCKPTHSFLQAYSSSPYDLPTILFLANHLIYYRKAVAIPPLHARDTYIVSPRANMHLLPASSVAWAKAFPLAPSLPNFLSLLSAAPRPYKTYAPSRDHRQTYMDMLAWLVRGGWVTQLRTFARILVWPEIIYEVDYQLKAEALLAASRPVRAPESPVTPTTPALPPSPTSPRTSYSVTSDGSLSPTGFQHPHPLQHPRQHQYHQNLDSQHPAPTRPMNTEQAAEHARLSRLAAKAATAAAQDASEHAQRALPITTAHPSSNNAVHLAHLAPHIIVDPHKVGHRESLYMDAIGRRLPDAKLREGWARLRRYFDGRVALEDVALREGMKRKDMWLLASRFQEHLLVWRHW